MRTGQLLATDPNGRRQTISVGSEIVRIGSAPDNDLVLNGPSVQPYHAALLFEPSGEFLIRLTLYAGKTADGGIELELPRSFAPALLTRVGGWVLTYKPASERSTRPIASDMPAEAPRFHAAGEAPDLLHALLQQDGAGARPAGYDPHDAVTMEMPMLIT